MARERERLWSLHSQAPLGQFLMLTGLNDITVSGTFASLSFNQSPWEDEETEGKGGQSDES